MMLTHIQIWNAIDRLANAAGLSTSGLARRAGLDPTSFNRSKRFSPDGKERWPSTESIAKILAATGADLSDLTRLVDDGGSGIAPNNAASGSAPLPRLVPILGFAEAGRKNAFDDHGYPVGSAWDEIPFPDVRSDDHSLIYALEISGDSMDPLYRAGDVVIVAPKAPVRRGDRVIVKTRKGAVMAKELVRRTATRIEFRSLNPSHDNFLLPHDEIAWIARILWVSQ